MLLSCVEIKVVTAYMLLRPFFKLMEGKEGEWEEGENWEIDESAWFPGTFRWDSQLLSRESHPHLRLEETLRSVPDIRAGDTVWWHADVCPSSSLPSHSLLPSFPLLSPSLFSLLLPVNSNILLIRA